MHLERIWIWKTPGYIIFFQELIHSFFSFELCVAPRWHLSRIVQCPPDNLSIGIFFLVSLRKELVSISNECNLRTLSQFSAVEWSTWDIHKALLLVSIKRTILYFLARQFRNCRRSHDDSILESIFLRKKKILIIETSRACVYGNVRIKKLKFP